MLFASLLAARGGDDRPHFLFPLLLLVLIGALIAWLIRRRRNPADGSPGGNPPAGGSPVNSAPSVSAPIETLQDRFARGEIDQAEYDHRKAVLEGRAIVPAAPSPMPTSAKAPAVDADEPSGSDG